MHSHASNTQKLTFAALCVALAVVLSYVKLFKMPQGGSITLEMAPLFLLSFVLGPLWGMAGGAICGLIQMAFGGYIVTASQAILDYVVAFGVVGIAGVLPRPWWLGACLGALGRLIAATASGVTFFASYAPEGVSPLKYSLIYNATYLVPSLVICLVVLYFLLPRLKAYMRVHG